MNIFETSVIYLAAFLRQAGFHYIGNRVNRSKMLFKFRKHNSTSVTSLDDLVDQYKTGYASCDPKVLRDSVRAIKSMIKTDSNNKEVV